jgi:hypothetical protein
MAKKARTGPYPSSAAHHQQQYMPLSVTSAPPAKNTALRTVTASRGVLGRSPIGIVAAVVGFALAQRTALELPPPRQLSNRLF